MVSSSFVNNTFSNVTHTSDFSIHVAYQLIYVEVPTTLIGDASHRLVNLGLITHVCVKGGNTKQQTATQVSL